MRRSRWKEGRRHGGLHLKCSQRNVPRVALVGRMLCGPLRMALSISFISMTSSTV
jgi:hypothetical protein